MGINPTPTNHRSFTYDGKSTREFGVYITGEGVFNAPERAVEMISIPGRDGEYALDQRHFNNIEVTYRAGIVADSTTDFAEAISNFRNWLASRKGYCRLTDEYNPNEYRMAVFKNVITVGHEGLETGEFDITFNCKPQRWLTSGETAVAVTSGGTITNPTLFPSSPLLTISGYGVAHIGDYSVSIVNVPIGTVNLASWKNAKNQTTLQQTFPYGMLNTNDTIYAKDENYSAYFELEAENGYVFIERDHYIQTFYVEPISLSDTFSFGTPHTYSGTATFTDYMYETSAPSVDIPFTITFDYSIEYDGVGTITFTYSDYSLSGSGASHIVGTRSYGIIMGDVWADSTKQIGDPAYIDCDIGECYTVKGGDVVSLNEYIDLGSDLPTLPPGDTEVTYDNTITKVEVKPNWWKV